MTFLGIPIELLLHGLFFDLAVQFFGWLLDAQALHDFFCEVC